MNNLSAVQLISCHPISSHLIEELSFGVERSYYDDDNNKAQVLPLPQRELWIKLERYCFSQTQSSVNKSWRLSSWESEWAPRNYFPLYKHFCLSATRRRSGEAPLLIWMISWLLSRLMRWTGERARSDGEREKKEAFSFECSLCEVIPFVIPKWTNSIQSNSNRTEPNPSKVRRSEK